jgi:hypothetical protein
MQVTRFYMFALFDCPRAIPVYPRAGLARPKPTKIRPTGRPYGHTRERWRGLLVRHQIAGITTVLI